MAARETLQWTEPVNSRDKQPEPRGSTLHCAIVTAPIRKKGLHRHGIERFALAAILS